MTHFFSCDWGTTAFRLRRVNVADGRVVAEISEPTGVRAMQARYPAGDASARATAFASFLREQLDKMARKDPAALAGVPMVMVSGMASSSVGWREVPYATVPVGLDGANLRQEVFNLDLADGRPARIQLISGLRDSTEMMRGEEVEILGLFADDRFAPIANEGLVLLPGTHSKHVRLRDRQIIKFHTYLTGELFEVLATHSLLAASVQQSGPAALPLTDAAAQMAFEEGVRAAAEGGLARSLFQTRARTVLQGVSPAANRWFLSGLLIGAEIADLPEREPGIPLLLAAPESSSLAYGLALQTLGLAKRLTIVPPAEMSLAAVRGQLRLLHAEGKTPGQPGLK